MRTLLVFCLGILIALGCFAQNDSTKTEKSKKKERTVLIHGEVYDSFTKAKLSARITLLRPDSTVIDTMTCWTWGTNSFYQFKVPAKPQTIIIKGTLDGYEDAYMNYELRYLARNNNFELPRLLMKKKLQEDIWREDSLGGVLVRGTKVKMAYRGDTIIYDASAFNLPEGSMLDGLIKQLPGAELKSNGDIYINGEKVDYLTLNGKDFFKGNNQVVLDNLPYYTVQNLKAYHKSTKKSQLKGRDYEKREFVMDVNLKREYNRGYVANAEAGGGMPWQSEGTKKARYLARVFGLHFDDHSRYTLFGNVNNINETRTPGGEGDWSPSNMPQGLTTTKQAGFDFSTEDADKHFEENGSARVEWSDARNETRTARETFTSAGGIFSGSWSESRQKDFRLNVHNEFTLKKPFRLYTRVDFSVADGSRSTASEDSTFRQIVTNQTQRSGLAKYRTYHGSGMLSYYKKLPWGDNVSVSLNGSFDCQKPNDAFSRQHTQYASPEEDEDRLERYADTHGNSYLWNASADYDFSLPRQWFITAQVGYAQERNNNHNNQYLLTLLDNLKPHDLGWLPSTHDSLLLAQDWLNSDVSQLLTRTYNGSLSLSKASDDYYFDFSLPFRHISERLHFDDGLIDTISCRNSNELCPTLNLYVWKGGFKSISYSMNIDRPDLASLIPTDETLDPLIWRISNPDLKNHVYHTLNMHYTHNIDSLKRSFSAWANGRLDRNSWGMQTIYDMEAGKYTYINTNVNGNWQAALGASCSLPLDKMRLLLFSTQLDASYQHSVDCDIQYDFLDALLTDPPLSTVNNWVLHNQLQLRYQKDELTATVSGNISWRNSTGDRRNFTALNAFNFDYGAALIYTIPRVKLSLATDIRMYSRRGYYSDMMNDNHLVWNAQLSRSFFKQQLTAKLQAFDLLHQLSSTQYEVNAQGRTETWHNCIPRYVMLTLQYKFTKMPKK